MKNRNHLIVSVMQNKLDWLRDKSFYLEHVESGPKYSVCYRSKFNEVRIIIHCEQREPLYCSVTRFIKKKWEPTLIEWMVNDNMEFAQLKEGFYLYTDLDLLSERVELISKFIKTYYDQLIGE